MENIIGDLRVLSDKCNRDAVSKFYFNYEYYLTEVNRILVELKQIYPEIFQDIDMIEDAKRKLIRSGSVNIDEINKFFEINAVVDKMLSRLSQTIDESIQPIVILERVFNRFHQVARQLRNRHDSRETIDVKDEYDVQDLIHALLKIYFDDIRPEEWTPSYAGSSSRMDFLIKDEKIAVEIKKTRDNLRDKAIGEQLNVDITKYKEHPNCQTLVCFVYDPEGLISNPTGLENDLSELSNAELKISVYVAPK